MVGPGLVDREDTLPAARAIGLGHPVGGAGENNVLLDHVGDGGPAPFVHLGGIEGESGVENGVVEREEGLEILARDRLVGRVGRGVEARDVESRRSAIVPVIGNERELAGNCCACSDGLSERLLEIPVGTLGTAAGDEGDEIVSANFGAEGRMDDRAGREAARQGGRESAMQGAEARKSDMHLRSVGLEAILVESTIEHLVGCDAEGAAGCGSKAGEDLLLRAPLATGDLGEVVEQSDGALVGALVLGPNGWGDGDGGSEEPGTPKASVFERLHVRH